MAAVDPSPAPSDPRKPTIGSLRIIRVLLDRARTTQEALDLIAGYNIDFSGGPPIHYLIADRGSRRGGRVQRRGDAGCAQRPSLARSDGLTWPAPPPSCVGRMSAMRC